MLERRLWLIVNPQIQDAHCTHPFHTTFSYIEFLQLNPSHSEFVRRGGGVIVSFIILCFITHSPQFFFYFLFFVCFPHSHNNWNHPHFWKPQCKYSMNKTQNKTNVSFVQRKKSVSLRLRRPLASSYKDCVFWGSTKVWDIFKKPASMFFWVCNADVFRLIWHLCFVIHIVVTQEPGAKNNNAC